MERFAQLYQYIVALILLGVVVAGAISSGDFLKNFLIAIGYGALTIVAWVLLVRHKWLMAGVVIAATATATYLIERSSVVVDWPLQVASFVVGSLTAAFLLRNRIPAS